MSEEHHTNRRTVLKSMAAVGSAGVVGTAAASGTAAAAGPTADVSVDPLPAEAGETLTFDASGSTGDIDSYEWYLRNWNYASDWTSNPSKTGQSFSESFVDAPWGAKLVVTDTDGNTDEEVVNFLVRPEGSVGPTAEIEKSPEDAERHAFSGRDSHSVRGTIESYEWYLRNWDFSQEFLDSPTATGPDFSDSLASGYHWKLKLVVTDSEGETDETVVDFYP